jgi:hypothetical protein
MKDGCSFFFSNGGGRWDAWELVRGLMEEDLKGGLEGDGRLICKIEMGNA